ncbi:uncharacterized protein [Chelonus insularis]|uniref:uncharacterized protein n=1 Tax=Chelonus insularis TaxID=460826 RepID=UPI00158DBC80|nr:uncharacterized protein LOC118064417 [Chelonus insularis]
MGRRKIVRSVEEEEEFQRQRRQRNAENQRKRRQRKIQSSLVDNNSNSNINRVSSDHICLSVTKSSQQFMNNNDNLSVSNNDSVVNQSLLSTDNLSVSNNDSVVNQSLLSTDNLSVSNDDSVVNQSLSSNNAVSARERQRLCQQRRNTISVIQNQNVNDINEYFIGEMDVLCRHCNAKHFSQEKVFAKGNSFNDCCNHGKVSFQRPPSIPDKLRMLFDYTDPNSKNFHERIRVYNSSFSFASFNANLINFQSRRPGPYCFKIQGQVYYQINTSLYPQSDDSPSFGQLFIIDSNEAITNRLATNSQLNVNILQDLDKIMRDHNMFAKSYQMMHEEVKKQEELALQSNCSNTPEMELLFTLKPGVDRRRFNLQQVNEVAAIFTTTADGEIPESYVSIRNRRTKELQYISTMNPNVEPWIYPLFYPYGSPGWHQNIMKIGENKRVSRAAYVKYLMSIRNDEFNVFLRGGRLFQQWLVDNYVKIEKDQMTYHKNHQAQLRVDTYQGVHDHLQRIANDSNSRIGKVVVLPATFTGSPRNMFQNYQDSMAIVRKYGKPDLFVTMTCNPHWKEITDNLLPNQIASDRPDLCARFFGNVAAYVYVIEFQKRGLPHIHLLITLNSNSKMTTPTIVDRYISAEIPDPNENPILHDIVMKNMIHGPCGNWCLINNKCSKHFPKDFQDETILGDDGYPSYRRRNINKTYNRSNVYIVDNRHVVPYCPHLIMIFNCHINVEAVASIKSVKYLFKYVYKGHDCATVTVGETSSDNSVVNHDEIKNYIETRYVSPIEATWRILSKPLQEKSHSIVRLPLHLPNQQSITIDIEMNEDEMTNALADKTTMLTDYFKLNSTDELAKQYIYPEIPQHYVFKKKKIDGRNITSWEKRKLHFNTIGRMYSVSPTQTELFHLRLLLLSVKGATSYENLRTFNNILYSSYFETCIARGLIEHDDEWQNAMHEAEVWMMPSSLRRLFVRILIHCQPQHPEKLWEEFKDAMSEDYTRKYGSSIHGIKKAYLQIISMLHAEDRSLADYPTMEQINEIDGIDNEVSIDEARELGLEQYNKLNEEQKVIVDTILNLQTNDDNNINPNHNEKNCFYIDGPGGSGKTFIYTTLWYLLRSQHKKVSTMAYTGIAATLLPNGRTVHKTFGLPVPMFSDSSSNIKIQSKEGKYLLETDVFIWDEAPMAPRYALEIMDRTLRDITNKKDVAFGGKIVVLGGDFRQLLPVKTHSTRSETVNLSIKFSSLWKNFQLFSLSQNMRVLPEEVEFAEFLLNLGNGTLNDNEDNVQIPSCCLAHVDDDIINDTYGDLFRQKKFNEATKCAILSARNIDVDEINKKVVELLDPNSERIYTSIDSVNNCDDNGNMSEALLPEYLNSLSPPNLAPHELRLRVNCIVMLIRNLSIHEGLCNGTRLLVLELQNNLLKCQILSGDKSGDIVFINRITLYCENVYPFSFKRRQFPIRLAFAMTINKSQGQTFQKIGIDLRRDVFSHGHLYVACSRVRSRQSLKIYLGDQRSNSTVKNYIYKELYL